VTIPIKWWLVEKDTKNLDRFVETSMGFASKGENQESLILALDRVVLGVYGVRPVMLRTLEYQATLREGTHGLANKVVEDLEFFAHHIRGRWIEPANVRPSISADEGAIYGVVQSYGLRRLEQPMISIRLGLAFSTHPLEPYFVSPELTTEQVTELRLPTSID
jgi:hypothetical protein